MYDTEIEIFQISWNFKACIIIHPKSTLHTLKVWRNIRTRMMHFVHQSFTSPKHQFLNYLCLMKYLAKFRSSKTSSNIKN